MERNRVRLIDWNGIESNQKKKNNKMNGMEWHGME